MVSLPFPRHTIKELSRLVAACNKVVITTHIAPDGDAVGSSLALAHLLSDLGKDVSVITPDSFPANLRTLPGAKEIVLFSCNERYAKELIAGADLLFSLDYNDLKRIDRVAPCVSKSKAPKVLIDHHLHPGDFADVVISYPGESSTCALLFKVICALGLAALINKTIGTCIYAGMMTDTGNFSYNSNNPELYSIIQRLVEAGVDKDAVYRRIINTSTLSKLKINAYAISEKMTVYEQHHAALIWLTRDELNSMDYHKGDTESLVNIPLQLPEVTYSVYLREEEDYIKVSTRSKGSFPVNEMCAKHFNGGGHLNAAGGEYRGTMQECIETFEKILPENDTIIAKTKQ